VERSWRDERVGIVRCSRRRRGEVGWKVRRGDGSIPSGEEETSDFGFDFGSVCRLGRRGSQFLGKNIKRERENEETNLWRLSV